ncbi:E3 ubiquitin-protein ligase At4g11680-like isoform X2 [Phragmites australis]|uniref:E3 ubiquitin-protein ligase At4g11680-like isoform X2 n=1 Tax=Phragmites australis TaxID=29695 RepID=UPI002D782352|nr:E3 ubiquitin-protein ligase At4g11680-like isoform X2 [Phragmites australis]
MASTSPRRSGDPSSPSSPLLPSPASPSGVGGRFTSLRGAARFIRRTGSRRLMREPSVAVRETAAEHLEERQTDWAYSKPVVVLDVLWNLAFVAVAAAVLAASLGERPAVPLRVWLAGYVLQCLLHVLCVAVEYRRRRREVRGGVDQDAAGDGDFKLSIVKHLESANTMFSFIWWIIGFYWVSAGGQPLAHDAPQLYWLSIVFLAFDVFFVVFCVALACVIGIAVCCCLPCIIAILYAVTDQEGASEEDINNLSKFKFRTMGDADKLVAGIAAPVGGVMTERGTSPPVEHILSAEDAECCICLCPYEDGVELRELPCNHHFHCTCIDKWLHINATCPLCKFNIVKSNLGREEV